MSRHVYAARDGRGYVDLAKSRVTWRIEVMKGDDRKDVATFTAALQEAQATITADGIDVADIRVVVDHDSEPDYDGDRITPKLVMTGQRPASRDEVEAENARLEKQRLARKAEEAAWLRKRLADVEGR